MTGVGILVSGRGSNMVALLEGMRAGEIDARCALVVSNVAGAPALQKAKSYGIPCAVVESRGQKREAHDRAVADELDRAGVELVCLAGYMRILSTWFVERYRGRVINIHPSLLPSFPGLHAHRQALEHGVRVSGCTVHFVEADVDCGPIIVQAAVPVLPDDDEDSLAARVLEQEHRIYPRALQLLCAGRLRIEGRRVVVADEVPDEPRSLVVTSPHTVVLPRTPAR